MSWLRATSTLTTNQCATTTGAVKRLKLPAGRFALYSRKIQFSPECWDTTKDSLKSSQLMDRLREGKGSGGRIFNAREMRRAWKTVQPGRTQAVQEGKSQELFVTLEV